MVGGGPAGAAADIAARRAAPELATLVLDRQRFPRDKACGDGLGPGVVARLGDLEASEIVRRRRPIKLLEIVAQRTEFVRESIELLVGEGTALSWRSLARLLLHGRTSSVASGQSSAARGE